MWDLIKRVVTGREAFCTLQNVLGCRLIRVTKVGLAVFVEPEPSIENCWTTVWLDLEVYNDQEDKVAWIAKRLNTKIDHNLVGEVNNVLDCLLQGSSLAKLSSRAEEIKTSILEGGDRHLKAIVKELDSPSFERFVEIAEEVMAAE